MKKMFYSLMFLAAVFALWSYEPVRKVISNFASGNNAQTPATSSGPHDNKVQPLSDAPTDPNAQIEIINKSYLSTEKGEGIEIRLPGGSLLYLDRNSRAGVVTFEDKSNGQKMFVVTPTLGGVHLYRHPDDNDLIRLDGGRLGPNPSDRTRKDLTPGASWVFVTAGSESSLTGAQREIWVEGPRTGLRKNREEMDQREKAAQ